MEKVDVGEYVRTEDGEIHKVIKIIKDDGDWDYYCCENNAGYFAMDIANHSKELIDLIEVGDFVNGFPILEPMYNGNTMYGIDEGYENFKKSFGEIQTILTKESYMANCYKVGGEDGI